MKTSRSRAALLARAATAAAALGLIAACGGERSDASGSPKSGSASAGNPAAKLPASVPPAAHLPARTVQSLKTR